MIFSAVLTGVLMGLIFSLLALGLSLIFGVMDIVNFAHGEFLMLGMFVVYFFYIFSNAEPLLGLPVAGAFGALLGFVCYHLIIKHALRGPMLAQLFSTFGLMLFLRYIVMFIYGPNYIMIDEGILIGKSVSFAGISLSYGRLGGAVTCIALFILIYLILNKTEFGMALQATAIDKEAAGYMGINTERMNAAAWVIGGATSGIAGGLLVQFFYGFPTIGMLFVMIAFAAVALGGFGSIKGAFFGGIIVGTIMVLSGTYVSSQLKFAFVYLAFFIVMIFMPQGLFGKR